MESFTPLQLIARDYGLKTLLSDNVLKILSSMDLPEKEVNAYRKLLAYPSLNKICWSKPTLMNKIVHIRRLIRWIGKDYKHIVIQILSIYQTYHAEDLFKKGLIFEEKYSPKPYASMVATLSRYKGTDSKVCIPSTIILNDKYLQVVEIGQSAFRDNKHLSIAILSEGIVKIDKSCFYGCSNLRSVTLPSTIRSIRESAFNGCSHLDSFVIPDGVERIYDSTFYDCSSLKKILIPESVGAIDKSAFSKCIALEEIVIPDSVEKIGDHSFYGCKSLKNVVLPNNLKYIDWNLFKGCESLTSIQIPDSVTKIHKSAFEGCPVLNKTSKAPHDSQ